MNGRNQERKQVRRMQENKVVQKKKKKRSLKKLIHRFRAEWKSISKPTTKQQFHGTWTTLLLAGVGALCISALDSVFTALMGLFF